MNGNYQIAKKDADKVDEMIINTLKSGASFIVEAGAGSGKTYSLNRVIEWIRDNKEETERYLHHIYQCCCKCHC